MDIINADDYTAIDMDNIDIIQPFTFSEGEEIKSVLIKTKSNNNAILTIEQYVNLIKNYKNVLMKRSRCDEI